MRCHPVSHIPVNARILFRSCVRSKKRSSLFFLRFLEGKPQATGQIAPPRVYFLCNASTLFIAPPNMRLGAVACALGCETDRKKVCASCSLLSDNDADECEGASWIHSQASGMGGRPTDTFTAHSSMGCAEQGMSQRRIPRNPLGASCTSIRSGHLMEMLQQQSWYECKRERERDLQRWDPLFHGFLSVGKSMRHGIPPSLWLQFFPVCDHLRRACSDSKTRVVLRVQSCWICKAPRLHVSP